jgi:GTPase SAR1 family protein
MTDNATPNGQRRPLQMGAKGAYIVRLLMVGDSACGKTSLVLRFDQNVFSTKFVTTIGVDYRDKMIQVRFRNVILLSCIDWLLF